MTASLTNTPWNMKNPLFVIHIPKTGGLSLRRIFAELLPDPSSVYKLGQYAPGKVHLIEDFMAQDQIDSPYPVYIGHFSFGAHNKIKPVPFLVTCLRDPVLRVLSYYEYTCRIDGVAHDIHQFISSYPECNNGMTRRLSGLGLLNEQGYDFVANTVLQGPEEEVTKEHLDLAIEHLRNRIDLIMVQERMSESLVMLRHRMGSPPLLSLRNHYRNHSPQKILTTNYSEEVINAIRAHNQFDLALYEEGTSIFKAQLSQVSLEQQNEIEAMDPLCSILSPVGMRDLDDNTINQRFNLGVGALLKAKQFDLATRVALLMSIRLGNNVQFWTSTRKLAELHCGREMQDEVELAFTKHHGGV